MWEDYTDEELIKKQEMRLLREVADRFDKGSTYNVFGLIDYDSFNYDPNIKKTYLLNTYIPTYKEYMREVLNEAFGITWLIVVPLSSVMYFIQRSRHRKFLDGNQEYLI